MALIACTDFSDVAENAVNYAGKIAQITGKKLILYHAFSIPLHASNTLFPVSFYEGLIAKAEDKLLQKAALLSKEYDIEVVTECSFSVFEDRLAFLIQKYDAMLLIMGMAPSSLEQDLLGNTTSSVIKHIKIPVFAVPNGVSFSSIKTILFACDTPSQIPQEVQQRLTELALTLRASIEIFSVDEHLDGITRSDVYQPVTEKNEQHEGVTYYYKNVRSTAVIDTIKKEIKAIQADMLIMAPRQYGFWEALVHRSKTRLMASGLEIPLLSLPY